jgi:uncharacterized protein YbaP (TraB family)
MDRMEPWYADMVFQAVFFQKLGLRRGVEPQIWDRVSPARRLALESPAEQVGYFADAPLKDQIGSLELTLRKFGRAREEFDDLLKAWLNSDLEAMDRIAIQPLRNAAPEIYSRLVEQRAVRWATSLQPRLDGSGRTVVIVSAALLIGPDGLPAQLRARGYLVEGPS